ncbi:hypothetical protein F8S20_39170 [Nostoc sp. BAE]|nr:hypothetical protein [Nostoc commune BAE]
MVGLSPTSDREFSLIDSNLLSGWISYLRTGYRDSLTNESHIIFPLIPPQKLNHCEFCLFCTCNFTF